MFIKINIIICIWNLIKYVYSHLGQTKKEKIVEHPGPGVKHISGNRILDNHSVNLISTILTGIVMPFIAFKCWP